jgi:hypothetical protein
MARLARLVAGLPVYAMSYPRDFRLLPAAIESIRGIPDREECDATAGVP